MDSNSNEISVDQVDARANLMRAIEENEVAVVRQLLSTSNRRTPALNLDSDNELLHYATKNQRIEIMQILLAKGAPVSAFDASGKSPLFYAVETKNDTVLNMIVKNLLSKKDDGPVKNFKPTLLLIACLRNDPLTVERLLSSGSVHANDIADTSLFCMKLDTTAIEKADKIPMTRWMLLCYHHIHIAVELGHMNIVNILLKYGAHVDTVTLEMLTALHLAAMRSDPYIVDSILTHCSKDKRHLDINSCDDLGNTPLLLAVEFGPVETIKLLLENGANVDVQNSDGNTALHFAAKRDCLAMIELLLNCGADVSIENLESRTPLHLAAKNKPLDVDDKGTQLLGLHVKKSTDNESKKKDRTRLLNLMSSTDQSCHEKINPTDDRGFSHFHAACMRADTDVIDEFLKNGVDVDMVINADSEDWPGYMPLHFAVENNCAAVVKLLLRHGADVNAKDKRGMTPLHIATHHVHINCMEMLLNENADVNMQNVDGDTALHLVAQGYRISLIQMLLNFGADVSKENGKKLTPLHLAAKNEALDRRKERRAAEPAAENDRQAQEKKERDKLLTMLLAYDRCYEKKSNPVDERGFSHFHAACMTADAEVIDVYLKNGVDVNIAVGKDSGEWPGYTPLHFAVRHNRVACIDMLVKHGANLDTKDAKGMSPLHIAARHLHTYSVKALLSYEVDINARNREGNNVLCDMLGYHYPRISRDRDGARDQFINIVKLLLEYGCDTNAQNENGETALHLAYIYYDKTSVKYIMRYGADINIKNKDDLVPANSVPCFCTREELEEERQPTCIVCRDIREAMIKLRALGFELCTENAEWFARQAQLNLRVNTEYEKKCQAEIEAIKKVTKSDDRSLYKIFFETPRGMGKYIFCQAFRKITDSKDFSKTYPIYCNIIRQQFRRGLNCKENFLGRAAYALKPLLNLPDVCCKEIANYLTVRNLRRLLEDTANTSKDVNQLKVIMPSTEGSTMRESSTRGLGRRSRKGR